jgi:hypothetical protein
MSVPDEAPVERQTVRCPPRGTLRRDFVLVKSDRLALNRRQPGTVKDLDERWVGWPRRIKEQERDHTNHSHDDTKMPTRSGLSFDPAAFCQAPLDLLDPEPGKPVTPAAEPTGYVSPLYDPAFEVLP